MNKLISDLKEWDKNPRSISKDGIERLKKQIQKLGIYKPLIIAEDNTILGGNMRYKALQSLGYKDVWVSLVKADTEEKKIEYALSDNDRSGQYEGDQLADLIGNFPDIEWGDYSVDIKPPTNLKDLIDQFKEVIEDEVPDITDAPAVSKLGEVYQLGRHRLMCGDATKSEDVEKLMDGKKADMVFTDPPYGVRAVNIDKKVGYGNGRLESKPTGTIGASNIVPVNQYSEIIGDDATQTAQDAYNLFVTLGIKKIIIWGGNYFTDFLPVSSCWCIWDKRDTLPSNNFADCEMAWTNLDKPARIYKQKWSGLLREGDRASELLKRVHPTQKPVGIHVDILKDMSDDEDVILDLFGGSGSTLIACEQTNRICMMMEIDPKYCDVIRKRYDNFIKK